MTDLPPTPPTPTPEQPEEPQSPGSPTQYGPQTGFNPFQPPPGYQYPPPQAQFNNFSPQPGGQSNDLNSYAIASLVTGILGFIFCPLIFHVAAIVLARMAPSKLPWNDTSRKMARAGEILGWVGIGVSILFFLLWVLIFVIAAASGN